jgi:RNA polymerase sigma factor (sigma-70 family)
LSETADTALVSVFRDEWPRLIGASLRIVGDLQSAEDVVQETLLTALDRWPLQGVPDSPGAWLMTACRNRARNVVRDTGRARQRLASMPPAENDWQAPEPGHGLIADDRLRLIVMCCHPLLTADGQVALTLRMVGGLTTEEIARAFHLPAAAIAQRIVRAKRVLKQHRADFPSENVDIGDRLPAVLDVIYLAFNEGYLAAGGETLTRGDLAFEAYRLACLLTDLAPDEPEPWPLRGADIRLSRLHAGRQHVHGLAREHPYLAAARIRPGRVRGPPWRSGIRAHARPPDEGVRRRAAGPRLRRRRQRMGPQVTRLRRAAPRQETREERLNRDASR